MAWAYYGELRRKVGALLRVRALPPSVLAHKPAAHDDVLWVTVDGRDPKRGTATLQIASRNTRDPASRAGAKPYRYTVSVVTVPENPSWIVER